MITLSVKDAQVAKEALQKAIEEAMTDKTLLVGIHEDAGNHEGDINNAQLGAVLHFGAKTGKNGKTVIPARPWLDVGVEQGIDDYNAVIEEYGDDLETALDVIGQMAAANAQQYMTDLKSPANSQATIDKKGSSNPLIDTGELRQSVTYSLTTERPEEGL